MRTVSYERSVQEQMNAMAREIGALQGDLVVVVCTLRVTLKKVEDASLRRSLTECIERIERALEERP